VIQAIELQRMVGQAGRHSAAIFIALQLLSRQ
jgi:hypothetical protein